MKVCAFSWLLAGSISLFLDERTASAAVFKIADGDVAGLKNAIIAANTNGEDDVIELAPNGTYTLATVDNNFNGPNGLPRIAADGGRALRLEGAGAMIRRSSADGTPQFRILYVSTEANVTILAVTITNGNLRSAGASSSKAGGGIYNDHGNLTVENGTFMGNSADLGGGIFSNGEHGVASLTLSNCTLVGNSAAVGGGIVNDGAWGIGMLNVSASTFIQNQASWMNTGGGALFNEGYFGEASVMIENSTFEHNAAENGGAIYNDGFQGHVNGIVMTSTLSTNSANASGGGVYNYEGSGGSVMLDVTNCTFSRNSAISGGAINDSGDSGGTGVLLRIGDNIFKSATSQENISSNVGTIISLGYNLSNDNGSGFLTGPGDQINTDPTLDPAGLQNNGGPTKTIALLSNSPAINAGNPTGPNRDQRYYLRNGVPDIGAFEYGGTLAPLTVVSRKSHGVGGTFDLDLTGSAEVECRSGGVNGDHRLIIAFSTPVTLAGASVTAGTGNVSNVSASGSEVIVNLTGISNAQQIIVTLENVSDGASVSDASIPMRLLLGDTNGNGIVNSSDVSQTKIEVGRPVTGLNFRTDLNASGTINATDLSLVKAQLGMDSRVSSRRGK